MDFGCLAHEVVVVDTFGTQARSDVRQDLGKSPVGTSIDERRARCVILCAADGDGCGIAFRMVIEGTIADTAVCYVRTHGKLLRDPAARNGPLPMHTLDLTARIKKTQSCDLIHRHQALA